MVGLIFAGEYDAVTCRDEAQQDSGDVHRRRTTDSLVRGRRHHDCQKKMEQLSESESGNRRGEELSDSHFDDETTYLEVRLCFPTISHRTVHDRLSVCSPARKLETRNISRDRRRPAPAPSHCSPWLQRCSSSHLSSCTLVFAFIRYGEPLCCCCPSTWHLSVRFGSNGISFCPNDILCHGNGACRSAGTFKGGEPVPSFPYVYPSVLSTVGFLVTNGIRRRSRSSRGNSFQCICSVWGQRWQ